MIDMFKDFKWEVEFLEEDRARVEVYYQGEVHMGTLYFERPKRRWVNKPILSDRWACVDAKVEGLYTVGEAITPKDIVAFCQDLVRLAKDRQDHPDKQTYRNHLGGDLQKFPRDVEDDPQGREEELNEVDEDKDSQDKVQ